MPRIRISAFVHFLPPPMAPPFSVAHVGIFCQTHSSPHFAVPNFVPTPCIEALIRVASVPDSLRSKSLETNNDWQPCATIVPTSKLLILSGLLILSPLRLPVSPPGLNPQGPA
jgi:hypothetical protein